MSVQANTNFQSNWQSLFARPKSLNLASQGLLSRKQAVSFRLPFEPQPLARWVLQFHRRRHLLFATWLPFEAFRGNSKLNQFERAGRSISQPLSLLISSLLLASPSVKPRIVGLDASRSIVLVAPRWIRVSPSSNWERARERESDREWEKLTLQASDYTNHCLAKPERTSMICFSVSLHPPRPPTLAVGDFSPVSCARDSVIWMSRSKFLSSPPSNWVSRVALQNRRKSLDVSKGEVSVFVSLTQLTWISKKLYIVQDSLGIHEMRQLAAYCNNCIKQTPWLA